MDDPGGAGNEENALRPSKSLHAQRIAISRPAVRYAADATQTSVACVAWPLYMFYASYSKDEDV